MNKQKKTGEGKVKATSKRVRFEVFKRDSLTCQDWGRKAPKPIFDGGRCPAWVRRITIEDAGTPVTEE